MQNDDINTDSKKHLDDLNNHLKTARASDYLNTCRKVVCADGFTMSVQASENHYCSPRNNEGPWSSAEIGYPSRIEPLLWNYADEPGKWTDTVYGYVPIELIAAVVEVHGGLIKNEKSQ